MTLIHFLGMAIWLLAAFLTGWGTWLAFRGLRGVPAHLDAPFGLFPVSILKPLKGVDEGLRANLETFFRLRYPEYELIFSVADASDPSIPLVRELIDLHPRVRARLIVGDVQAGANPKVNNLVRSYEAAQYDWILISDSNVRVRPDYLRRLVAQIDNSVGVVTSVVAGVGADGFASELEAAQLNMFYARGMYQAEGVGRPCVVGKSMLFQRSVANRFGGMRALAPYLAEDFMMGEAMRRLGLRVQYAADPVPQHLGASVSLKSFWDRHVRWGRIRKTQSPVTFALEPLFTCFLSGVIGAFSFACALDLPHASFMALHLLFWGSCDLVMMRAARVAPSARTPLVWFARELAVLPLWAHIAAGNTVKWRGRSLRLLPGGILELPEEASATVERVDAFI